MTQKAGWEVGSSTGLFVPTWSKLIKDSRECAMKQISFRAKVHGRTSFAFWKCQMRPKIRACVKDFFSFSRDLTKHISSIPTSTMACSTLVPSRGAGPCFPQAAHPSGHCIHPTASIHLHPSICTRHWAVADGSHELNVRLRIHSSPTGLRGFSHYKSFVFCQDLSIWKREELSILALVFFRVIRVNVTHVLWVCDSSFFFLLLSIFMFLSKES